MNHLIDGRKIQTEIKTNLIKEISSIKEKLTLVVIQVGNDIASSIYVKNKKKVCQEMGIIFKYIKYDYIEENKLINKIEKLNKDPSITGILIQLPLPDYIDENKIINAISPAKDIDGLTKHNIKKLNSSSNGFIPCTALAIIEILNKLNIAFTNKKICIVGKSKLVGIPLNIILKNQKANVIICDSKTNNLKKITSKADIVIVAIGKKEFITEDYIKEGAIVIDVGINRENGKIYGDCHFEKIYKKCDYITPVPGGVGPVTVVMTANNVLKAYYMQKEKM